MSNSAITKTFAILIGLSMLTVSVYPAFAQDSTNSAVREIPNRPLNKNKLVQDRIEAKRENIEDKIASMREKLASKAAALHSRLQDFRDKKKAEIAERVNTNLNRINQNRTTQMQKHLDKMSEVLDRLEARVNQAKPDIKDPAAARAAIAAARLNISTASASVSAQALKDYTIVVTSEGRIGLDAKIQRDKLHSDLVAVRRIVIEARQAVANAIRIAKSGKVEIPGLRKEGTNSGRE